MTKNKAMEILGIGRTALENMLKAGQLQCVMVGNSYRIPEWSLEQCQKNTVAYHTKLSSGDKYITLKSLPSSMDNEYSFVKARTQRTKEQLNNMRKKDSHKSLSKPNIELTLIN